MQRAAAVQWSRGADGNIHVTAVRDFGVEPLSNVAKTYFAQQLDENTNLPAVPRQLWATNRYSLLNPVANPPMRPAQVCAWMKQQANANMLYEQLPVVVFPGHDLQVSLHNLPVNAAALEDFVLNLGRVVFVVARNIVFPHDI